MYSSKSSNTITDLNPKASFLNIPLHIQNVRILPPCTAPSTEFTGNKRTPLKYQTSARPAQSKLLM